MSIIEEEYSSRKKELLLKVCHKYSYIKEIEYYSRGSQIGSYFYDKFFFFLGECLKPIEDGDLDNLWRAVNNCHTPLTLQVTSSKIDFSFRYFNIPNIYNVIQFELAVNNLISFFDKVFAKNHIRVSHLIDGKYFGYGHQIENYTTFHNAPYQNLWNKFNIKKERLIRKSKFIVEYDIKGFYDTIDHNELLSLLSLCLKLNLSTDEYNSLKIDRFLHDFSKILFKVAGYKTTGLPQGVLGSDFTANLFLWLIIYNPNAPLEIALKDGVYSIKNTKFLHYVDDFSFFSDDAIELEKISLLVRDRLSNVGLVLNSNKRSDLTSTDNYTKKINININKIRGGDTKVLEFYKKTFVEKLSDDKLDIPFLKQYVKRFFLVAPSIKKGEDIITKFQTLLFSSDDRDLKKVLLLAMLSPINFLIILNLLIKFLGNKVADMFSAIIEKYSFMLSDNFFVMFLKDIECIENIDAQNKIQEILNKNISSRNNPILLGFLGPKVNFFDNYFKAMGLKGLNSLFCKTFKHTDDIILKENILGIKFNSIFHTNIDAYRALSDQVNKIIKDGILMSNNIFSLGLVVDNLMFLKSVFPNFFLYNETFIADLVSLFNTMLTMIFSFKEGIYYKIQLAGTRGTIKDNNEKKRYLVDLMPEFKQEIDLFWYLVKLRAKLNHKEMLVEDAEYGYSFNKYKNIDLLNSDIGLALNKCSMVLEKEASKILDYK